MERIPRLASRTRKRVLIGVAALALVAATALAAGAQPGLRHHRGPGRCGGHGAWSPAPGERAQMFADRLLRAADELNLTEEQQKKLRQIRRAVPSTIMPKRQAVVEARMDMHDLMQQKDTSAADLRKAHDRVQKAQSDLQSAMFDLRLQARDVLTPEQRDKLHKKLRPHPGRGPGRMGEGPGCCEFELGMGPGFGPGDDLGMEFGPDPVLGFVPHLGLEDALEDAAAPDLRPEN
jgi:Spy/CpxP family protein refolding chaperone